VRLSSFRALERLPGAAHPALYRVLFECSCGEQHPGLVSDDELDWAPLGLGEGSFVNLMTARLEAAADELADFAVRRIQAGDWPWSFFCYPENRPRPVSPSSFFLLAPGDRSGGIACDADLRAPGFARRPSEPTGRPNRRQDGNLLGVAIRCPCCKRISVNLVSTEHVDLPFHNDPEVGVVPHVFTHDAERMIEEFRAELDSASFDARRLLLD
jgi:hypothetical protein